MVLAATGGVLAYAPYLPRLVSEGLPPLVWAGSGSVARVAGGAVETLPPGRPLGAQLDDLFVGSSGQALLVAHRGRLELEHYAPGAGADTRFNSFSMVKSLVGALVFRALADGRLGSLDQRLGEFLPDYPGVAHVTLRALLMMRAGIHFESDGKTPDSLGKDSETAPNPFGPMARLHFVGLDAVGPALTAEQGDQAFNYQNINTALLGKVLEGLYGRPLPDLLSEAIWAPSGATDAFWRQPGEGMPVSAYCCLYATARDWIRVGIFLAGNGSGGVPFLPDALWREYLGLDVAADLRRLGHYGPHTKQDVLDRPGATLAGPFTYFMGQGGQMLYLMPERDLVVLRFGDGQQLLHSTLYAAWDRLLEPAD